MRTPACWYAGDAYPLGRLRRFGHARARLENRRAVSTSAERAVENASRARERLQRLRPPAPEGDRRIPAAIRPANFGGRRCREHPSHRRRNRCDNIATARRRGESENRGCYIDWVLCSGDRSTARSPPRFVTDPIGGLCDNGHLTLLRANSQTRVFDDSPTLPGTAACQAGEPDQLDEYTTAPRKY